jgi:hypothetical protein
VGLVDRHPAPAQLAADALPHGGVETRRAFQRLAHGCGIARVGEKARRRVADHHLVVREGEIHAAFVIPAKAGIQSLLSLTGHHNSQPTPNPPDSSVGVTRSRNRPGRCPNLEVNRIFSCGMRPIITRFISVSVVLPVPCPLLRRNPPATARGFRGNDN